ncbi:MAG: hypothetical protein GWP61_18505 [Chloroflexi bacterium]|nr:hypothetical protein [Chloroflexota bacterium]
MQSLSTISQITFYVLLVLIGLLTLIIWGWQIQVLRGKAMKNPDGSADDWHEQKIFYGISVADVFVACPLSIIGIVLVFVSPRWGVYLLASVSFWLLWSNVMTTATSLRFEKPRITLNWFIVFPFGALVGVAYLVWTVLHFDIVY